MERALFKAAEEEHASYLMPQQLGVGVKSGISLLVFGLRGMMEMFPDFVFVSLDTRNAHNEFSRAMCLKAYGAIPSLAHLVPYMHSMFVIRARVQAGDGWLNRRSEEGGAQGAPGSSPEYCVTTHKAVRALDAAVAAFGGCARFYSDNGFVCGPANVVWPAIERFAAALAELNLVFRMDKGECHSPNGVYGDRPVEMPIGSITVIGEETVGYGINVCNIPVGDGVYVERALNRTCMKIEQKIASVSDKLILYPNESWACHFYSCAHQFDYWMQNVFPAVLEPFSHRIDVALLAATERVTGIVNLAGDLLSRQRSELPVSLRGLGLRSHKRTANSAFTGTVNQTVPRFIDHVNAEGDVVLGYFKCLTAAVGEGSFDAGVNVATRYSTFIGGARPTALALRDAWVAMRDEVGQVPAGQPPAAFALDHLVEGARGSQRELTRAVELARFRVLDAELMALPNDDQRKVAWVSVDRNSSIWVASCPSGSNRASPTAFREIANRYMGLPSPCARALNGQTIWSATGEARGVCDVYGNKLTSCTLSGDGYRTAHDTIKEAIALILATFGLRFTCEVFGLFSSCIPEGEHRDAIMMLGRAKHQGMVPDFRFEGINEELGDGGAPVASTQRLAELKRVNFCRTNYPTPDIFADGGRMSGVRRRAAKLQTEYEAKARNMDGGVRGPCYDRLRAYGGILGLVVGHFGEFSPDLNRLIMAMAQAAVPRVGRLYSMLGAERAKAALASKARRDIAWAGLNANAKLLLDRSVWVGPTFVAINKNYSDVRARATQQRMAAANARTYERAQAAVRQGFVARGRAYGVDGA